MTQETQAQAHEVATADEVAIVKVRFQSVTLGITKAGQRFRTQLRMPANAVAIVGADAAELAGSGLMVADVRYHFTGLPGLAAIPGTATREWMALAGAGFAENAGLGLKIYYAQPQRLGIPRFEFGGVVGGFLPPTTAAVTDTPTGITENYYLWESTVTGLGETEVTVNQPGL